MTTRYEERLDLALDPGLRLGASQVWGGIRIVPVLRAEPLADIRLSRLTIRSEHGDVATSAELSDGTHYLGYMPQGLMVTWGQGDDRPAVETALGDREVRRALAKSTPLRGLQRKLGPGALRMVPQHLALEGLLALHFGGPDIAYGCWSRAATDPRGLSPRWETVVPGEVIVDLRDALRLFERHVDQVGVLLYVADALAGVTIAGHPDDYAALHRSLILDFYARTIWHYALLPHTPPEHVVSLDAERVSSLDDLRSALASERSEWAAFRAFEASGLLGRTVRSERVRRLGDYGLHRFLTGLATDSEQHIGELIRRKDGAIAWLKTMRLDADQVRRAALIDGLARAQWSLSAAARERGVRTAALREQLVLADLGYLLDPAHRR